MRRPGTNPNDVQPSDVLCDYCHRAWTDDIAMLEGHQGSCVCEACLTAAFVSVVRDKANTAPAGYKCRMCLENEDDRAAQNRPGEPGWTSPKFADAVICRRCIKLGAGALDKDADHAWTRPVADDG